MGKTFRAAQLQLRPVPVRFAGAHAQCPQCGLMGEVNVLGRVGLRLVFLCHSCGVRFYRAPEVPSTPTFV